MYEIQEEERLNINSAMKYNEENIIQDGGGGGFERTKIKQIPVYRVKLDKVKYKISKVDINKKYSIFNLNDKKCETPTSVCLYSSKTGKGN